MTDKRGEAARRETAALWFAELQAAEAQRSVAEQAKAALREFEGERDASEVQLQLLADAVREERQARVRLEGWTRAQLLLELRLLDTRPETCASHGE